MSALPDDGGSAAPGARYRRHLVPLVARWRAAGSRVGLFGAGPHTDELFSYVPELDGPFLVAVLDNDVARQRALYRGRPVHPSAWATDHLDVIVCSSYVNEARLAAIAAPSGCEVVMSQGAPPQPVRDETQPAHPAPLEPPGVAETAVARDHAPASDVVVLVGVPAAGKSRRLIQAVNDARAAGGLARVFLCRDNPRVAHKERDRTLRCRDPHTWCDLDGFLTSDETVAALDAMPSGSLAAVDDSQSFSVAVAAALLRAAARGVRCIVAVPSPLQLQLFREHGIAPTELTLACQRGCGRDGSTAVLTESGQTLTVCGACFADIARDAEASVRRCLERLHGQPCALAEPVPIVELAEWPAQSPRATRELDSIAAEFDDDHTGQDAWVPSATLLDLDCGMGARLIALAERGHQVTAVGRVLEEVEVGRIVDRVFTRRHVSFRHDDIERWLGTNQARFNVVCAPAVAGCDDASGPREWDLGQIRAIVSAARRRVVFRASAEPDASTREEVCARLVRCLQRFGCRTVRVVHIPELPWAIVSAEVREAATKGIVMDNLYYFGRETTYADGGEPTVERAVASARDRSAQSDELNGLATDWPTTYHLSRARTNLLQPFRWQPGLRVLEIGAGCGVLTRFLGETGARIDAIEPAPARARIAALRTSDLANVRVGVGRLADFRTAAPFDVAVLVGVLEYCQRYGQTPDAFLATVRALVAPRGILIVAIENQIGLKYQLGHGEDHLGRPFAGIEGYPESEGVRTFSRHQLGVLVERAGFTRQRWLYPFPDYKLPTTIVDERALATPEAARAHLSLVRDLVSDPCSAPTLPFDPRKAMNTWAEAGLAAEVSNSFLLVAGDSAAVDDFIEPDVSLWQFTSTRRLGRWGVRRTFGGGAPHSAEPRVVRSTPLIPGAAREGEWLHQHVVFERPFVSGPTLLDDSQAAAERGDEDGVKAVCLSLRTELERHARPDAHVADGETGTAETHPFSSWMPERGPRLPGRFLDAAFDNFVRNDEGLHFIDVEWQAAGGVDLFAVLSRALRLAAERAATWRTRPWPASWTGAQIFGRLLELTGIPYDDHTLERALLAEAEFQRRVLGGPPAERRSEIERALAASPLAPASEAVVGSALRSWAEKTATDIATRDREVARLGQLLNDTTARVHRAAANTAERDREIARLGQVLGDTTAWAQRAVADVEARDREIVRLNQVLGEVTAWAQRSSENVATRDEQLRRLSAALADLRTSEKAPPDQSERAPGPRATEGGHSRYAQTAP